jgi:hypothetical protein
MHGMWFSLQAFLVASANISKLLWGSGGKQEAKRPDLRDRLGVSDASVLRDPDLRNDFEHIDSRLDLWLADPNRGPYVGRNIGPPGMVMGPDPSRRFHHFDPETGIVTFWEHSVSVPSILAEVSALLRQARMEDSG